MNNPKLEGKKKAEQKGQPEFKFLSEVKMETRIQAESDPRANATTNVSMSVLNKSKGLCVILKVIKAPGTMMKTVLQGLHKTV